MATYGHAAELACIITDCGRPGAPVPVPGVRLCGDHEHLVDDNVEEPCS